MRFLKLIILLLMLLLLLLLLLLFSLLLLLLWLITLYFVVINECCSEAYGDHLEFAWGALSRMKQKAGGKGKMLAIIRVASKLASLT